MKVFSIACTSDNRGSLSWVEWSDESWVRFFWIINPKGTRGGHDHHNTRIAITSILGSFDLIIKNGKEENIYNVDPSIGIILEPGDFHYMKNFSDDNIIACLASHNYDPNDYIYSE